MAFFIKCCWISIWSYCWHTGDGACAWRHTPELMSRRTDPVTGAQVRPVAGHRPATKEMCVCVCAQHLGRATDSPADLEILNNVKRCEMGFVFLKGLISWNWGKLFKGFKNFLGMMMILFKKKDGYGFKKILYSCM